MSDTYLPENNIIKDTISQKKPKLISLKSLTFLSILLTLTFLLLTIYYISPKKNINKIIIQKENIQTINPIIVNPYISPFHADGILSNLFYPYSTEIIRKIDEFEFLRDSLGKAELRMVFNSNIHGDYSTDFHEKTNFDHILVLIQTEKGNRFGVYTSGNFSPVSAGLISNTIEIVKSDKCAFLFNLDTKKIFDVKKSQENNAITCDDFYTIYVGDDDLLIPNYFLSKDGISEFPKFFGEGASSNELTGGEKKFKISSVEAFQVLFYSEFGDEKNRIGEHLTYIK